MNHERQSRREIWQRHLSAAKQFPGTVDAYCAANRISTASFYYWKKKLERDRKAAVIPSFIPVEVVRSRSSDGMPDPKWLAEFVMHLSRGA